MHVCKSLSLSVFPVFKPIHSILCGRTWLVCKNLGYLQTEGGIHRPEKELGPSKRPLSKTFRNLTWCTHNQDGKLEHVKILEDKVTWFMNMKICKRIEWDGTVTG